MTGNPFNVSNETQQARNRKIIDLFEDGTSQADLARMFELNPSRIFQIIDAYQYDEPPPPPPVMRDRLCNRCRKPCRLEQYIFTCDGCKNQDSYKECL